MKHSCAALLALLVMGCVSIPVPVSQAVNVPADRYFWIDKPKSKNPGTLVLIRDTGTVGLAAKAKVSVDEKPLAELGMGEKAEVKLDPDSDEYVIQVALGGALGSMATVNQVIRPSQTYYYRIYTDQDAYVHFMRLKKIE